MNNFISPLLSPCLLSTLAFIALLSGAPTTSSAQLIWSDEFSSGSAPDSNVWSYDLGAGGWGNNELQEYTDDIGNVRIEGGNMVIAATDYFARGKRRKFKSARVKSQDKLTFKYGTIEARMKIPQVGNGLWPAFWTLGNNFGSAGWPDCGELDIMEMGNADAIADGVVERRVGSTAHWDYQGGYAGYGLTYDAPSDITGSFHTFRMEWTPNLISTYIDNNWIWSFDISDPDDFDGHEFHEPHFILFNLAVGGTFTGNIGADDISAPLPAEYVIDYVRIYDNGHTVLGGSSIGGGDTTSPAAPTGLTADGANGIVDLNWSDNSESDLATYNVYRSTTSGGPYDALGTGLALSAYTDANVTNGLTYHYVVTALDTSSNESANSAEATATPEGAGGGTLAHVDSIIPGSQGGGPKAKAKATVTIRDENGSPVNSADVTATFSGTHNETVTATTDANGVVNLVTSAQGRNPSFTVCIDAVISSLTYDSAANVETCDTF